MTTAVMTQQTAPARPGMSLGAYYRANPLQAIKDRIAHDPVYFIKNCVWIQRDDGTEIKLKLWKWQEDYVWSLVRNKRNMAYKGVQIGVSWINTAVEVWLEMQGDNRKFFNLSKNETDSKKLIRKIKFIHSRLKPWMRPKYIKANDSYIETSRGGIFESYAATGDNVRSDSAYYIFIDEAAFMRRFEEIFSSSQSRAKHISVASSAFGFNHFRLQYYNAKRGDSIYVPHFFNWRSDPTRDEAWYKDTASVMSRAKMNQDHPENEEDGFIQSGNPVFDSEHVKAQEKNIIAIDGRWKQYTSIKDGMTLSIGIDPSFGVQGGDPYAVQVIDANTGEQVAESSGYLKPDIIAHEVDIWIKTLPAGVKYIISVERNNHGHAVLLEFKHLGTKNIYHDKMPVRKTNGEPGFETTKDSKKIIIDGLEEAIRKGETVIHSRELLDEMFIYQGDERGGTNAPDGYHDDRIMAYAIAWHNKRYALREVCSGGGVI